MFDYRAIAIFREKMMIALPALNRVKPIYIKEVLTKISGPLLHWKRTLSYESPECPPKSLGGHS